MLYQLHEYYRSWLRPWSEFAGIAANAIQNPSSPHAQTPYAERMAAALKLIYRVGKDYEKPKWDIQPLIIDNEVLPVVVQTVIHKPFCNLLNFKRYSNNIDVLHKINKQPKILLCAPLSGHHSTLLKDTVCSLINEYDVYITDWIDARTIPLSDGCFNLDDYIGYIQEFIRFLGNEELNVISVCQPTVPVLAAVALMASNKESTPKTLVMMGGPIDARKSPTAVNSLAINKSLSWFEHHVIYKVPEGYAGEGRLVYPGFLQHAGFVSMNSDRHFKAHWDYYLDLMEGDKEDAQSHVNFYNEYNAVLDMSAEYYLQTLQVVFQDFALPCGTWMVNGQLVKPQDIISSAILTIEGELDDISGCGQTMAALDLCSGVNVERKEHYTVPKAGHYGIFSGRRWRHNVAPMLKRFINKHQ
jgi:poly(3-hydroxybutyrate) depolymerase